MKITYIVDKEISINYSRERTKFGEVLIASTPKGVCYIGFDKNLKHLKSLFPSATFSKSSDRYQECALLCIDGNKSQLSKLTLNIKGTDFQLKVWDALLKIERGELSTYMNIANAINNPKAVRAVGTAIGRNPVSVLIPCHRVIRTNGELGGYAWGLKLKRSILDSEKS